LKSEISSSFQRVKKIKYGAPLKKIIKKTEDSFFVPDVESYFTGSERNLRKRSNEIKKIDQIFITETKNHKSASERDFLRST
jgi:hypothetical protein